MYVYGEVDGDHDEEMNCDIRESMGSWICALVTWPVVSERDVPFGHRGLGSTSLCETSLHLAIDRTSISTTPRDLSSFSISYANAIIFPPLIWWRCAMNSVQVEGTISRPRCELKLKGNLPRVGGDVICKYEREFNASVLGGSRTARVMGSVGRRVIVIVFVNTQKHVDVECQWGNKVEKLPGGSSRGRGNQRRTRSL